MTWTDDAYGKQTQRVSEVKVYKSDADHTWSRKINKIGKIDERHALTILTPAVENIQYTYTILNHRPVNILLVCENITHCQELRQFFPVSSYPLIKIYHAQEKIKTVAVLIDPATVYIGSVNFGAKKNTGTIVGIRSQDVHDWLLKHEVMPMIRTSKLVW